MALPVVTPAAGLLDKSAYEPDVATVAKLDVFALAVNCV
jgi:hypothetical protein